MTIFDSIKYPVADTESGLPYMDMQLSLPAGIIKEYQKQFADRCKSGKKGDINGVELLRKVILEWDENDDI